MANISSSKWLPVSTHVCVSVCVPARTHVYFLSSLKSMGCVTYILLKISQHIYSQGVSQIFCYSLSLSTCRGSQTKKHVHTFIFSCTFKEKIKLIMNFLIGIKKLVNKFIIKIVTVMIVSKYYKVPFSSSSSKVIWDFNFFRKKRQSHLENLKRWLERWLSS